MILFFTSSRKKSSAHVYLPFLSVGIIKYILYKVIQLKMWENRSRTSLPGERFQNFCLAPRIGTIVF